MRNSIKSTYRSFNRRPTINLIDIEEIALLIVSWQSWKAATKNPVKTLRYE